MIQDPYEFYEEDEDPQTIFDKFDNSEHFLTKRPDQSQGLTQRQEPPPVTFDPIAEVERSTEYIQAMYGSSPETEQLRKTEYIQNHPWLESTVIQVPIREIKFFSDYIIKTYGKLPDD